MHQYFLIAGCPGVLAYRLIHIMASYLASTESLQDWWCRFYTIWSSRTCATPPSAKKMIAISMIMPLLH